MIIIQLIYNLSILIAASIVSGFIDIRFNRKSTPGKILQGITFGLIAVIAMLRPFEFIPGVLFDGRTVILSLCALFFGPVSGIIAAIIAIITRIILGGEGTLVGVLFIISSTLIGIFYFIRRQRNRISLNTNTLFIFGIIVHVVIMLLIFLLPKEDTWLSIRTVGLSIIVFFPLATILIGKILLDQENAASLTSKLKKSEERFRSMLENLLEGCQIIGFDWKYQYLNKAAETQNRRSNRELLGKKYMDVWHGIENTEIYRLIKQCLEKRTSYLSEIEFTFPDGAVRWFNMSLQPVPEGVFILSFDITERKKAEADLLERERHLSSIYNTVGDVIFHLSVEGEDNYRFLSVNSAFCKVTGLNREIVEGKTVTEVIPEPSLSMVLKKYRQAITEKSIIRWEETSVYPTGQRIGDVSIAPVFNDNGRCTHLVGSVHDITERKKAENELRHHQKLLNEMGRVAKIGAWEFDPATGKGTWTDEVARIHDLDPADETSMELGLTFYQEESRIKIENAIKEAIESGKSYDLELELITKKGTHKWVKTIGHPTIVNGKAVKVQGSFQDITDKKMGENILISRTRLFQYAGNHNLDDLLEETLNEVEQLTGSSIGFVHFVDPDQKSLTLQGWSTRTKNEYCKAIGKGLHYVIEEAGVWVDCVYQRKPVIHNDYASLPHKKGMPEGHSQVIRELVVPVIRSDKIVAILGVGNKLSDYEDKDINIVSLFADLAWDIAQRKRNEEEIQNTAKFPSENTNPVLRIGSDGIIQYANAASDPFLLMWKRKVGMEVTDDWKQYITVTLMQGSKQMIEFKSNDRYYSCHLIPIKEGGYVNIYGFDITERKLSEAALMKSNAFIESILEQSTQPTWISNEKGTLIRINPACCKLLHIKADEVIGKYNIFKDNIVIEQGLLPQVKSVYKEGKPANFEIIWNSSELKLLQFKKNVKVILDVNIFPIRDVDGNITNAVIQHTDITERKHAGEKIRKLNEELEERVNQRTEELEAVNKELKTFTYSVSHDLKAPLRGIDGYSRLLMEQLKNTDDKETRHFLTHIREGAQQMGELIDDLLTYSRLERSAMQNNTINIKKMANTILSSYSQEIKDRNITLKNRFPDTDLKTDENGFSMALRNLIENALKFTKSTALPVIELSLKENKSAWIITVTDNGIGFEMKYHDKIYEIFQRLHRVEDYPGTGVGLALVNKAMQRIGGKVWATSSPGKKTCFYLEIPKP